MATALKLRNTTLNGITDTGDGILYDMETDFGASADTTVTNTTAGGTEIQHTKTAGGSTVAWISGRAPSGGFTLTTTDVSIWQTESSMNANIGGAYRIYKRTAAGVLTQLAPSTLYADGVEMNTSAREDTWAGNPTDTAFAEDDRILIRLFVANAGTMGGGFTGTVTFNAASAATGDSFFNIAETVAFKANANPQTASPELGVLDLAGFAPSVLLPVLVGTALGVATLTGFAPTVTATQNTSASTALGQLTASGFAPTVLTPVTVTPGVGVLDLTGLVPTVQLPVVVRLGVAAGRLTAHDTFTATTGTLLQDHTSDSGHAWTQVAAGDIQVTAAGRLRNALDDDNAGYLSSYTPAGADYSVEVDVYAASFDEYNECVIYARSDASLGIKYYLQLEQFDGEGWLFLSGGGFSPSLSAQVPIVEGGTHRLRLSVNGSSIQGYVDGVLWIDGTDSEVTGPGQAGLGLVQVLPGSMDDSRGFQADDFQVLEPPLVGYAPTVTVAAGGVTASPALGELSLTGFAPTAQTPVVESPAVGVLNLVGLAPTIQTPVAVTVGLGALTLDGFSPAVFAGTTVTTGIGALDLVGLAPTVATTAHVLVTPGVGVLALTGFLPTAETPVTATTALGVLTLTGFSPGIEAGTSALTATGVLTLTGFAPDVTATAHVTASPAPGELSLTGFAPSVETPVLVTTGLGELLLTGYEPSAGGQVEVNPGAGQLVLTGYVPQALEFDGVTVNQPYDIDLMPSRLTVEILTPALSVDLLSSPTVVELV